VQLESTSLDEEDVLLSIPYDKVCCTSAELEPFSQIFNGYARANKLIYRNKAFIVESRTIPAKIVIATLGVPVAMS
jgi:hypothetical protein